MDQKTVDNICRISMEFGELVGKKKMKLPDEYAATDYLVDNILEWSQEFEKSFDDVGGLGVRPYPEHDIAALKEKYPRAAAFLLAESWEYMPHYMRSTAGIKAKERIINGEDYTEVIKDMKAEWDEYIKDHRWD